MVRFADDIVVTARSVESAERIMQSVSDFPLCSLEIQNQIFQLALNLLNGAVSRLDCQNALLLLEVP